MNRTKKRDDQDHSDSKDSNNTNDNINDNLTDNNISGTTSNLKQADPQDKPATESQASQPDNEPTADDKAQQARDRGFGGTHPNAMVSRVGEMIRDYKNEFSELSMDVDKLSLEQKDRDQLREAFTDYESKLQKLHKRLLEDVSEVVNV